MVQSRFLIRFFMIRYWYIIITHKVKIDLKFETKVKYLEIVFLIFQDNNQIFNYK